MKGCPYDNAVAEATFKVFKTEFATVELVLLSLSIGSRYSLWKAKWIDFSENYAYNILSGNFQISLIITSKGYILLADRFFIL